MFPTIVISTKIQKGWAHPSCTMTILYHFLNLQTFNSSCLPSSQPTHILTLDVHLKTCFGSQVPADKSAFTSNPPPPAQTRSLFFLLRKQWSLLTYHIPPAFKAFWTLFFLILSRNLLRRSSISSISLSFSWILSYLHNFSLCLNTTI